MKLFKNYKSKKTLRTEIEFLNRRIENLNYNIVEKDKEIQELTDALDKSVTLSEQLEKDLNLQQAKLDYAIQSLNNVSDNIYELQNYIKNLKDENSGMIVDYEAIENLIKSVDTMLNKFDIFYTTNAENSLLETQSYPSGSLGIEPKFYKDYRGNPYKGVKEN